MPENYNAKFQGKNDMDWNEDKPYDKPSKFHAKYLQNNSLSIFHLLEK